MAEEKTTFHRDEPLQEKKKVVEKPAVKKEKTTKTKKNKDWLAFLVLFLGIACAVTAVLLSGVFRSQRPE